VFEFLRNLFAPRNAAPAPTAPEPEAVPAEDYLVRLTYAGKGGEGIRLAAGQVTTADVLAMLGEVTSNEIEIVEPRSDEIGGTIPTVTRPAEARAWVSAYESLTPVSRHAIFVLEALGAVDPSVDTLVCALFDGSTDTTGNPDFGAMVGGVAWHWDEATGDMLVRPVVGWGGAGVRGDADRTASRLIATIARTVQASRYTLETEVPSTPAVAAGRGGLVCGHCGFASAHQRAFYCPKCGMRLVRG
jgi:hypothetical protein